MDHEPFCAQCARHIRNCCQTPDVYVTSGDVDRIAAVLGSRDFCDYRLSADPTYLDQDDDPTWRECVLREDGARRTVKHAPNGDCIFLGPTGCGLEMETRPLTCRLFPFDYTEQGILDQLASGCPTELLAPGQNLIDALGMNLEDARRWHRQLYDEIRQERAARCALA